MSMMRDLLTGFVKLHILFHASEGPIYGSELMEELKRHGYRVGSGSLYPVLHAMHRTGHLDMRQELVEGRLRKYYTITDEGRKMLAEAKAKAIELTTELLDEHSAELTHQCLSKASKVEPSGA